MTIDIIFESDPMTIPDDDPIRQLVNRSMVLLTRPPAGGGLYQLYVSSVIQANNQIVQIVPDGVVQGATLNIFVYLVKSGLPTNDLKNVYFRLNGITVPPGYRSATLSIAIIPPNSDTGDVGGPEGGRPTAVDYADADENP